MTSADRGRPDPVPDRARQIGQVAVLTETVHRLYKVSPRMSVNRDMWSDGVAGWNLGGALSGPKHIFDFVSAQNVTA